MENTDDHYVNGRIEQILKRNLKLVKSGFNFPGRISENKEQLDAILDGLDALAKDSETKSTLVQEQQKRIAELLEILLQYTMMDFSQKLIIGEAGDELDAVALGLNTLGEELENHIIQLKANESAIQEKNADLLRSNKQLEQFVYIASHDLLEPLRTISNYVGLFQDDYKDKLEKNSAQYLDRIIRATGRMELLIADLLEYARVGKERGAITVNCNILIKEVLNDLDASIQESKVKIELEPLPVVYGNYFELKSLFQNLISNAIKFRKKDSPLVVHIRAEEKINEWVFAVKDNGIGIEKKFHERIFLIFQKLHHQNEYSGTGIGLAHCKKIVEVHQGKIWLESELGKGSAFYFTIPKPLIK